MALSRLLEFPNAPAPNNDPASVRGNLSLDQKQLLVNILAYHVAHHPRSTVFAHDTAGKLRLVEANIRKTDVPADGGAATSVAETVHEVTVEDGMLNVHGTLAGPCAINFLDVCTFSTLFCQGLVSGRDASGLSTSMNVHWHAPAKFGATVRIVATTLSSDGRIAACRAEAYDKQTGRMLASMVHTIVPFERPNLKAKL